MNTLTHLLNNQEKPSRVVILGANGFIGKAIHRILEEANINTLALGREQLDLLSEKSPEILASYLKKTDSIIFLATITPDRGSSNADFIQNIQMAKNACNAFEKVMPSHFIYLSSDTVYPLNCGVISEKTPTQPENLFGVMHLSREYMFQRSITAPSAFLRSTLVYGFEDTHNSYGPNRLRRMALNSGQINLFGNGEEKRDHIYVNDLSALISLILSYKSTGVLNLVTGNSISYMDLAKKIVSLCPNPIEIVCSERKNPITHRHFDSSSIYKAFPKFNFTPLDDGLKIVQKKEMDNKYATSCLNS